MSEEKQVDKSMDNCLWIGTWNVHNWYDGTAKPNLERIIKSLQETNVDIIGFQEAMKESYSKIDALTKLKKELKFKALSTEKTIGFYHGVAMASKYEIIESFQVSNRLQLNVVKYTKHILLGIICIHFNVRDEKMRITEYMKISQIIKRYEKLLPLVFIGDFNALTKSDYIDNEWKYITKIREDNQWEVPKTELLEIIKNNNYFYDSLYLYQQSIVNHDKKNNDKVDEEKNDNNNDIEDVTNESIEDNKRLNGAKWTDILGIDNLGTCSFDTRIDYILINEKMFNLFDIVQYQHLAHSDASDHKLVRVGFKLKNNENK